MQDAHLTAADSTYTPALNSQQPTRQFHVVVMEPRNFVLKPDPLALEPQPLTLISDAEHEGAGYFWEFCRKHTLMTNGIYDEWGQLRREGLERTCLRRLNIVTATQHSHLATIPWNPQPWPVTHAIPASFPEG